MLIRQVIRLYAAERAQGELLGMLRTFNLDVELELHKACEEAIEELFEKLNRLLVGDDGA